MNDISKTIALLAVLVSDWFYTSTWADTRPPLNCYSSSVLNCDAYIYIRNVTEPINTVASRFKISAQEIIPFSVPDYLAIIQCSCSVFLGVKGFFYKVNYTVQSSEWGEVEDSISHKYFSDTAWTEKQLSSYKPGEEVELALGCGCPIPGWHSIISYTVPENDTLWSMSRKFDSNIEDIISLNKIEEGGILEQRRVLFVPFLRGTQEKQHLSKYRRLKAKVATVVAISLILLSIIIWFYCVCRKRASFPPQSSTATENGTEQNQEQQEKLDKDPSLPTLTNLTHDEIIQMKSYCTQCYEIGEGSFGRVYKGNLKDKDVAIKQIRRTGKDSKKLAENEVRLLQGKEHKNLVALIAWCIEENTFYLVYEYVNGCTLDKYLRENCAQFSLSWRQCLRIISSIAEGIEFLHLNKIIHVDIKPQNLMVDRKDNQVKIIDFGLSRHVDWEGTHKSTDRIAGTKGYWAPEYCLNHKLSYKHDVYSFGIVVLEVITGQKHVDNARGSSQFHIPDYVRYMMACNRFEEALDERFKEEGRGECGLVNALAVANLALKCTNPDKEVRPDMSYVMKVLIE